MNRLGKRSKWTLLGLLGVCIAWAASLKVEAQSANSVSGQATGTFAATPLGSLASTPVVTLPADGGMATGEEAGVGVTGVLQAEGLATVTTGVIGENASSAQSLATASDVNILNGVVTAKGVIALSSSASNGIQATTTDAGSTIVDLVVNGMTRRRIKRRDRRGRGDFLKNSRRARRLKSSRRPPTVRGGESSVDSAWAGSACFSPRFTSAERPGSASRARGHR